MLRPDEVALLELPRDGAPAGAEAAAGTGTSVRAPGTRGSALFVPVPGDGEIRRVAMLISHAPREFSGDDVARAETLAAVAGAGLARLHAEQAASTDGLTGLLNHGAILLRGREEIARARRDGTPLGLVIIDLDNFKRVNDLRGHQAGDELLRKLARVLEGELRLYDQIARYGGDEFVLLLPGSDQEEARAIAERVRLAVTRELLGACSIGVAQWHEPLDADGLFEEADQALLLAKRTGKGRVAVANADVERELARVRGSDHAANSVQALAAAIEERDGYTRAHSDDVVRLARGVAMILGLATDQVERIAQAALLHDVGKLATPREILDKPGPLTPEEWATMSEHPIAGERIVSRVPELVVIAPVVRHEHENWDGSGYPDGLRARAIPAGSRIVLACDAYQAMITDRPYRRAMPPEQAAAHLREGAGTKFDPDVVEALLDLLGHAPPQVPVRNAPLPRIHP